MTTQQWPDKEIPAPGADLATDERTNAAARAIFCVIKPSNMVDSDWDSGAVLGLGNAFRSQCINAARAAFAAVPASEPVKLTWPEVSAAAQQANQALGQWMPERWVQAFVKAYNKE